MPPSQPPDVPCEVHQEDPHRFAMLEEKIDANALLTQKLIDDTAELLGMWRDAAVILRWVRLAGAVVVWLRNVALACATLYALWEYGSDHGRKP